MGAKIIDKLNEKITKGEPFFSFEYFPPKTDEGVANLKERQMRMVALSPTFCDITWGAGGSTADVTLDVARSMQQEVRRCILITTGAVLPTSLLGGRSWQGGVAQMAQLPRRTARHFERKARLGCSHPPRPYVPHSCMFAAACSGCFGTMACICMPVYPAPAGIVRG